SGDRGRRLGGPRHCGRLPARPEVTREQVYGRRAVREALRGRREVLELWATERALHVEPWLEETKTPRVQVKPERALTEAIELASVESPLLVCLDQVADPRNLGAVCRSAEGAGATGVVLPAHGSARVTPAVCRASAGAVEHLPVAVVT